MSGALATRVVTVVDSCGRVDTNTSYHREVSANKAKPPSQSHSEATPSHLEATPIIHTTLPTSHTFSVIQTPLSQAN